MNKYPPSHEAPSHLHPAVCPACGYSFAMDFFSGGAQPLATLGWPESKSQACSMKRLPLDFVSCLDCGHIYNRSFSYLEVPYVQNANLMFNQSALWKKHLKELTVFLEGYLDSPCVLEIGCGNGEFLNLMADSVPGKYIGFDPNANVSSPHAQVQVYNSFFEPEKHLAEFQPDLIVIRHVLEHLMNPLAFLQRIEYFASKAGIEPHILIEVPCIDRVFQSHRIEDFYYEHNSHFTSRSFAVMLGKVSAEILSVQQAYGEEVIWGLLQLRNDEKVVLAERARHFFKRSQDAVSRVKAELQALLENEKVVIWGGTGKAAAFMHFFNTDAERFPWVVDSDPEKVGCYVPGLGQEILSPEILHHHPEAVILIATQWRSADIVCEIERSQLPYKRILLEHQGMLRDYFLDEHPYKIPERD